MPRSDGASSHSPAAPSAASARTPAHNAGVGRRLKLRQREEALTNGIRLIEWTFDPLELKNAFFNIERLGAIVRRYAENQYGTTSSPLHGAPAEAIMAAGRLAAAYRVYGIRCQLRGIARHGVSA